MAWSPPRRTALFLAGLGLSAALTLGAWLLFDVPLFALFLVLPFLPFLFRGGAGRAPRKRCPRCAWTTDAEDLHFCPRDGERLDS